MSFELFESIYIGKIGLKDYQFIYSSSKSSGNFHLTGKSGDNYNIEVRSNGKPENGGKYKSFRIFSPSNDKFDIKELVEKIVFILNKNRLDYEFTIDNIVSPKYKLQPYGLISVDNPIKMVDLEKLVASTKQFNNKVKKGGDFDQFTF